MAINLSNVNKVLEYFLDFGLALPLPSLKTANCVAANWDFTSEDPQCTFYSSVTGEVDRDGYQSVKCQQGT